LKNTKNSIIHDLGNIKKQKKKLQKEELHMKEKHRVMQDISTSNQITQDSLKDKSNEIEI